MMINDDSRTFFNPGEIVRVRHKQLENVPVMYVVEKVTRTLKNQNANETIFVGIRTRWFDNTGRLQEAVFSSKDLEHVK